MYGLYKKANEVMQHIVTKFVIKPLAAAYLLFALKKALCFFSKLRNACKEIISKIRLVVKLINAIKEIARPKMENPIAIHKFFEEVFASSQPQIIPPKKATIIPPYIAKA